jgi:hypothetical protein
MPKASIVAAVDRLFSVVVVAVLLDVLSESICGYCCLDTVS